LEQVPLQAVVLPEASPPDLFPKQQVILDLQSVTGVGAFRVVSQVQQHVLLLI
jgi:hypothetical protein